ncbi:uncharacterized protein LOC132612085 [Lycium barbarum]|uniref:uncharacterized protein LOC132612085 n=1 Tax=Lycium barbarum TaxID=112863 RepID=UPI00293E2AA6|nr:uncharacterized protein LOC132612085 [Lycium barbarum]
MTSPMIQKDIVSACKIETIKAIPEEFNGDYFALLVHESFDVLHKEQMAIVLRYISRNGFPLKPLLDIVHVQDTSVLSLKRVLKSLVLDARLLDERAKALGYLEVCRTYEVAFMLHLMSDILGISNELNNCLKKKQYLANTMLLVEHDILVSKDCFGEATTDLLHEIACLNPIDSFSSFGIRKIMKMAKFYPDDFDEFNMDTLEIQLASYIIDVRDVDERFSNLKGLCDLSKRLVQKKKHSNYPFVFRLVKRALLLLVATASVERVFSAMKFIKNDL